MKSVRILTSQVIPGMIVADDIYTFNNHLLVSAGTKLTDKAITRLKFYSIKQLRISVPDDTPDPLPLIPLNNEFYSEKIKNTIDFKDFNNSLLNVTASLKTELDKIIDGSQPIDCDALYYHMDTLATKARNGIHLFDMLHCLRNFEDETYIHSVNVALICNMMAQWLNFGKKDIEVATLCGLLHDIGKLCVPKEIINKPGKLTEQELKIVRSHTIQGYNLLQQKDLNIHIKLSAAMHHERCDGSGYPMGVQRVQIDRFAKIVMIADVYDAMTSARVYRGALCPFEVLTMFCTEGFYKFDPKYLMTFIEHVYQTYVNNTVRLNNKSIGKIVMMNQFSVARPVVALEDNTFMDLTKENNIFIEAIL